MKIQSRSEIPPVSPFREVISAFITKSVSASCCLYMQVCDGRATTLACFSDVSTTNCLSPNPSPDTWTFSVGDIPALVDFVGVSKMFQWMTESIFFSINRPCAALYSLLRSLSACSSRQDSYEYGISAPLQSRNDMVSMEPFNLNIEPPGRDTVEVDFSIRQPESEDKKILTVSSNVYRLRVTLFAANRCAEYNGKYRTEGSPDPQSGESVGFYVVGGKYQQSIIRSALPTRIISVNNTLPFFFV